MIPALTWLDWAVLIAYFVVVEAVGLWSARFTKTTRDFFLAGQRFSWWMVSVACVATLVGSYSFINYSEVGFKFGLSSATNYMNEWFVMPLFLFGWLPIIYYSKVLSIPEYFERRFDRRTRMAVLAITLIYLEGYVGINLLTMGVALKGLFGWDVMLSAGVMAALCAAYLYAGGQTAVFVTDLVEGFLLLAAGLTVFALGVSAAGGWDAMWAALPAGHKLPFARFNAPAEFHFVGEFWNDAMTGTFAFYFINQGVLMRFLSAKSVQEGRKAMIATVVVLMPLAAVAVGGAGWAGKAMAAKGLLPSDLSAGDAFVRVSAAVCRPGVFGFVIAAMIAALMSTLNALINAASAVAVNDIWKAWRPGREDAYYLRAARMASLASAFLGILLIPVFARFASLYQALSYFTAIVTPPLVAVIFLGVAWPRFRARAAFWTLILGSAAMFVSVYVPELVAPFAHGESPEYGHSYMRSLYGLVVSFGLGLALELTDRSPLVRPAPGLTLDTVRLAEAAFRARPAQARPVEKPEEVPA